MADQAIVGDVRAATGGWWLLLLVGVLSIAVGVTILFKPGNSLATLAVIIGIFILIDGILGWRHHSCTAPRTVGRSP